MLVTLLFWYMVIGVCFGFLTCYAVLKKYGTWQAICGDFNKRHSEFEDCHLTPKVAFWLMPLMAMIMFSIIWMPFLIYVGSRKV